MSKTLNPKSEHFDSLLRQRGFTLIELMVVLAVAALLLAIGAPSFNSTVSGDRIASQQSDFSNALTFARSEAMKRGLTTYVSGTSPTSGNEFGGGWTIWVDSNGNGVQDTGEPTLRTHESLNGNTLGSAGMNPNIGFLSSGFLASSGISYKQCASGAATGSTGSNFTIMATGLVDLNSSVSCP